MAILPRHPFTPCQQFKSNSSDSHQRTIQFGFERFLKYPRIELFVKSGCIPGWSAAHNIFTTTCMEQKIEFIQDFKMFHSNHFTSRTTPYILHLIYGIIRWTCGYKQANTYILVLKHTSELELLSYLYKSSSGFEKTNSFPSPQSKQF